MINQTTEIRFQIPTDLLQALNQEAQDFGQQARLLMALHLFETHKLTLGQAIQLADLSRARFLVELDQRQIPVIDYDPAELAAELDRFDP